MVTRLLNIVLRCALLVALFASVALYVDYQADVASAICAADGGCGAVRSSDFSSIFGIPVPVIGVGAFLGLLVTAVWASAKRHLRILAAECVLVALGALGFIALQVFWIKAICPWCMAVDISALLAAGAALLLAWRQPDEEPTWLRFSWAAVGVAVLALPLLWPISEMTAPQVVTAQQQEDRVNLITFTDFQCPYCRRLHKVMVALEEEYGDKLHVARLMRPLVRHKGAKPAAIAYLCMPPDLQPEFADQLYQMKRKAMTPEAIDALALAAGVDAASYHACIADPAQEKHIDEVRTAFRASGMKGIPATFVEGHFVKGASEKKLRRAIDKAFAGESGGSNLALMIAIMGSLLGAIATLSAWQGASQAGRGRQSSSASAA